MIARLAHLGDLASALQGGGYLVEPGELGGEHALLAENPYALVGCIEADTCDDLATRVSDAQAALTQLAAKAPSPRKWDLYLLVHVLAPPADREAEALIETLEADTRYARKFVRVAIDLDSSNALDRALRPLLPLRPPAELELSDPLGELRSELLELDVPENVAAAALEGFGRVGEVRVP